MRVQSIGNLVAVQVQCRCNANTICNLDAMQIDCECIADYGEWHDNCNDTTYIGTMRCIAFALRCNSFRISHLYELLNLVLDNGESSGTMETVKANQHSSNPLFSTIRLESLRVANK